MEGHEGSIAVSPLETASESDRNLYGFYRSSFQHSQGNQPLQEKMFIWAEKQGLLNGFTIPKDMPDDIRNNFKMPALHTERGGKRGTGLWDFRMASPWRGLHCIVTHAEAPYLKGSEDQKEFDRIRNIRNPDDLVFLIAEEVIKRDLEYQNKERAGRTSPTQDDGPQDPHASFIRRYGLFLASPGNPIFQELYRQMHEIIKYYKNSNFKVFQIRERLRQRDLMHRINTLANSWERNHPGQRFFV